MATHTTFQMFIQYNFFLSERTNKFFFSCCFVFRSKWKSFYVSLFCCLFCIQRFFCCRERIQFNKLFFSATIEQKNKNACVLHLFRPLLMAIVLYWLASALIYEIMFEFFCVFFQRAQINDLYCVHCLSLSTNGIFSRVCFPIHILFSLFAQKFEFFGVLSRFDSI